jgi:hypothetical protein
MPIVVPDQQEERLLVPMSIIISRSRRQQIEETTVALSCEI